jgi:hypothetical protein
MIALLCEYGTTLWHHVYGGIVYASPARLFIALGMTGALALTLGLLMQCQVKQSQAALRTLTLIVALVWVAMLGFFEGGYNHAYKDALFLAGVPAARAAVLHPNIMGGEYVYPPDDLLFETSGVLQLVAALFLWASAHRFLVLRRRC